MEHDVDMSIFWAVFLLSMFVSLVCGIRAYQRYRKGWKADPEHPAKQQTVWQFIGTYYIIGACVPSAVLASIVSNILYRSGPSWYQLSVNFSVIRALLSIAAFIAAVALLFLGIALLNYNVGNIRSGKRKVVALLLLSAVLFVCYVYLNQ